MWWATRGRSSPDLHTASLHPACTVWFTALGSAALPGFAGLLLLPTVKGQLGNCSTVGLAKAGGLGAVVRIRCGTWPACLPQSCCWDTVAGSVVTLA